jgi:hypothetical protein
MHLSTSVNQRRYRKHISVCHLRASGHIVEIKLGRNLSAFKETVNLATQYMKAGYAPPAFIARLAEIAEKIAARSFLMRPQLPVCVLQPKLNKILTKAL